MSYSNLRHLVPIATAAVMLCAGCKTFKKINQTLDTVNRLGNNINDTINSVKGAAKDAKSSALSGLAKVPELPASVTGGVDLSATKEGKVGSSSDDLDEDGVSESVTVFVDDADDAFLVWQGDASSDDAGVCYLAWPQTDAVWIVFAGCEQSIGAWVCEYHPQTDAVACGACNEQGECVACDVDDPEDECLPPEPTMTDATGGGEGGSEGGSTGGDDGGAACEQGRAYVDDWLAECGFEPLPADVCPDLAADVTQCADDIDASNDPCADLGDGVICPI